MERPKGLAADEGCIYLGDYSGRLQVFDKKGLLLRTYWKDPEESEINLFSYIQWIQAKENKLFFTRELGDSIYSVTNDGNAEVFLHAPGHYVECFRFQGPHIYFMSPWERTLFRVKTSNA